MGSKKPQPPPETPRPKDFPASPPPPKIPTQVRAGRITVGLTTWTCNNFKGHYPVPTALVVTADNIDLAIKLVEQELSNQGLPQTISREQLVPLPTHHRYVRILANGEY